MSELVLTSNQGTQFHKFIAVPLKRFQMSGIEQDRAILIGLFSLEASQGLLHFRSVPRSSEWHRQKGKQANCCNKQSGGRSKNAIPLPRNPRHATGFASLQSNVLSRNGIIANFL